MRRCATVLFAICWIGTAETYLGSTETLSRSSEAEQLIFEATNEFRVRNSLSPLIWDQRLSDIAFGHSTDMLIRDFFDHKNPDGQDPTVRIHRQHRQFIGNTGENVSVIYGSPPLAPADISKRAVDGWLNSPPHRVNMLDSAFTHVGIGVAVRGLEAKVTQNFMQVRGILTEPVPEFLRHNAGLKLEVVSFPENSPKAKNYILEPLTPTPGGRDPAVWPLATKRPPVAPGRYTIHFCFPAPRSHFFEVFPGPEIEIMK